MEANGGLGRPVTARIDQASSSKGQEQGGPGRDTALWRGKEALRGVA
jgi:hypothetical protein